MVFRRYAIALTTEGTASRVKRKKREKIAYHERCDGISTHCHEDLLPSTPGMEVAG
jgi:hypothetical protein